jgi:predicted MFS family arabinose efflux permease
MPYRYTLLIPPFLYILYLAFCAATRHVRQNLARKSEKVRSRLPLAIVTAMAFALLLRMVGEQSSRVFFNVHMDLNLDVSTALIGGLAAAAQLIAIPAALAMPLLTRLLGRFALFIFGLVGMSASLVLMALVPHWAAAGTAFIGIACMHAVVGPTSVVFQQEIVAYEWREVISGATTMAIGIGSAGIAFGGGFILSRLGYRSLFLAGAVSVALGACIFWLYFRTPRGEYASRQVR